MSTLLYRLARLAARHPWRVVAAWLVALVTLGGLAAGFGSTPTNVVEIPHAKFQTVMDRLETRLPDVTGTVGTAVFTTADGSPIDDRQRAAIESTMQRWQRLSTVETVLDPFNAQARLDRADAKIRAGEQQLEQGRRRLDRANDQLTKGAGFLELVRHRTAELEREAPGSPAAVQARAGERHLAARVADGEARYEAGEKKYERGLEQLQQGREQRDLASGVRFVSEDGSTALSQIGFRIDPQSMSPADRQQVVDLAKPLADTGVNAYFGSEITQAQKVVGPGEVIGLVTAAVVLLLMLGSLVAAGLPLLSSLLGVGVGLTGAVAASHFFHMHAMTPALALMLGLAVGIDYLLFIVNRHRQQYLRGMELHESIGRAVGTAGSAVVFAGSTVVVALAALVVSGIPLLGQMGLVAAGPVAIAVAVAVTLGPAVLALLGRRVASRRTWAKAVPGPADTASEPGEVHGAWFVRGIARRPWWTALGVLGVVAVMAIPTFSLRLGLPDGSAEAPDSSAGRAYATVAEEFGPGMNGPLVVLADLPAGTTAGQSRTAGLGIARELHDVYGVGSVVPIGTSADHRTLAWQVVLDTGPTTEQTADTVQQLVDRGPELGAPYDARLGFTGRTVANLEVSQRMAAALAPYLAVVVGLSLLILVMVFRSVVVPLIATAGFLLSVAAAFGTMVAVYQWGWLGSVVGVHTPGPLMSFGPIMIIGVLFGLAMDYQMFLVSGMREAYAHGEPARRAVVTGFTHGARVVTAAMLIMAAVFGGFVFSEMTMVRPLGFGLAVGVLVDAVLVRMTLTPALMHILGDAAWWMPAWLDRLLPDLDVEGTRLTEHLREQRAEETADDTADRTGRETVDA